MPLYGAATAEVECQVKRSKLKKINVCLLGQETTVYLFNQREREKKIDALSAEYLLAVETPGKEFEPEQQNTKAVKKHNNNKKEERKNKKTKTSKIS